MFHDPSGVKPDELVIQFDNAGIPLYNNTSLHGSVPITGGLQTNHWYRVSAHIRKMPDNGLHVTGILQDLDKGGRVIITTEQLFPRTATPPWYDAPETRWAVGVLDLDPAGNVDTYVADIYIRP